MAEFGVALKRLEQKINPLFRVEPGDDDQPFQSLRYERCASRSPVDLLIRQEVLDNSDLPIRDTVGDQPLFHIARDGDELERALIEFLLPAITQALLGASMHQVQVRNTTATQHVERNADA